MAMVAAWAEYIGCMKIRNVVDPRFADPTDKWYDPHNLIFVGDDSRYAEGPFYVVHGRIISGILRSGLIPRLGGPEGAPLCSTLIAAHRRCVSQAFLAEQRWIEHVTVTCEMGVLCIRHDACTLRRTSYPWS